MAVEQIHTNPSIYCVKTPLMTFGLGFVKSFFIHIDDEWLMVYTGAPHEESYELLEEALSELDIDKSKLRVFLTHLHLDHAGQLDRLFSQGIAIYLGKTDLAVAEPTAAAARGEDIYERLLAEGLTEDVADQGRRLYKNPLYFTPRLHRLHLLEDGSQITVGNTVFKILELRGHTSGHLALWEPESGLLFSGDHILFDRLSGLHWDSSDDDIITAYANSLLRLKELPVQTALSSHDEQNRPASERIDIMIEKRRVRAESLIELIRATPGINCNRLIQKMSWNIPYAEWESIPLIQRFYIALEVVCTLDHLVKTGRAERDCDAEGLLHYRVG
ncbi:MAG TPA: hypothetical protein DEB24_03980 [Coriobacteriia bacterium]|nr:hypothetical protein [Coriobacteriia bacterium]